MKSKLYPTPLRSRQEITKWILGRGRSWQARGGLNYRVAQLGDSFRFCWNVKIYAQVRTEFDFLTKLAVKAGALTQAHLQDEAWLATARQRWQEFDDARKSQWLDHVLEQLRELYVGADGRPSSEGMAMTQRGVPVQPEFAFLGRSGGWLCLLSFENHVLAADWDEEGAARMSYPVLRNFYQYLVLLEEELKSKRIQANVEMELAYLVFTRVITHPLTADRAGEGI